MMESQGWFSEHVSNNEATNMGAPRPPTPLRRPWATGKSWRMTCFIRHLSAPMNFENYLYFYKWLGVPGDFEQFTFSSLVIPFGMILTWWIAYSAGYNMPTEHRFVHWDGTQARHADGTDPCKVTPLQHEPFNLLLLTPDHCRQRRTRITFCW